MNSLIQKKIIEKVPLDEPAMPWLLQSFFVRLPHSDKARLIIDCQPLNLYLSRPVTPFSPANEVLSQVLPSSKWFCRFDLKDTYFCVALTKEASKICTFLTRKGATAAFVRPWDLALVVMSFSPDVIPSSRESPK